MEIALYLFVSLKAAQKDDANITLFILEFRLS